MEDRRLDINATTATPGDEIKEGVTLPSYEQQAARVVFTTPTTPWTAFWIDWRCVLIANWRTATRAIRLQTIASNEQGVEQTSLNQIKSTLYLIVDTEELWLALIGGRSPR